MVGLRAAPLLLCVFALAVSSSSSSSSPPPPTCSAGTKMNGSPDISRLRGGQAEGGDGTQTQAAEQEGTAEDFAREQMEYWNSLSKEQQNQVLEAMSPEEREVTEAFLAGKPQLRVSEESVKTWLALSEEERQQQLQTMTPDQREAILAAVEGNRQPIALQEETT